MILYLFFGVEAMEKILKFLTPYLKWKTSLKILFMLFSFKKEVQLHIIIIKK